ncbi:MAG: flagellar type III secretion system pore protein FliP [Clostridiales bacterium]|nr:flagellar type III secretion system pore protein FliP [Clostridiales bacterium]
MKLRHSVKIALSLAVGLAVVFALGALPVSAAVLPGVDVSISATDDPQAVSATLQLVFLLAVISLAPSLLVMMTSFTRIIISLHFLRSALGTQQMPPNQVLVGLALFITMFLMGPILTDINENALQPYANGQLAQEAAIERAMSPLREYMFSQVEDKDMALFLQLNGETYASNEEIPNRVLIPAYMLTELTLGFKIGFLLYLPFVVIDMVVASVLMAMGMMMLPPAMISLPFKILLFVLADGWSLVISSIIQTFRSP